MGIHTHKSTGVHTHTNTITASLIPSRNRKLVEFLFMSREGRSLSLTDHRSLSLTDLFRETTVSNDGTNRTTKKLRRRTESGLRKSVCVVGPEGENGPPNTHSHGFCHFVVPFVSYVPFTQFLQNIKDLLRLSGEIVFTQLLQLSGQEQQEIPEKQRRQLLIEIGLLDGQTDRTLFIPRESPLGN